MGLAAPGRKVWVLMFDEFPADLALESGSDFNSGDGSSSASEFCYSAFDELELTSAYFEQFIIQDTCENSGMMDVLGGRQHVSALLEGIRRVTDAVRQIRLVFGDQQNHEPQIPAFRNRVFEVSDRSRSDEFVFLSGFPDNRTLTDLFRSLHDEKDLDLLWLNVELRCELRNREWAENIVSMVRNFLYDRDGASRPVLLVTSLRGRERRVDLPFSSEGNEGRMHAPLWIDAGLDNACRIQSLVGSFDLLPTIAEYLAGSEAHCLKDRCSETAEDTRGLGRVNLSSVSLVPYISGISQYEDRLIIIDGGSWAGARTQDYFLVRRTPLKNTASTILRESCDEAGHAEARFLFLKPDDYWNVNNVVATYESIADELEQLTGVK